MITYLLIAFAACFMIWLRVLIQLQDWQRREASYWDGVSHTLESEEVIALLASRHAKPPSLVDRLRTWTPPEAVGE